jgi:hypothetical protein
MRTPTPPRPPVAANLEVVARTLGLSEAETAVLLFVVTCARQDMQKLLDPIACHGSRGPAILIAAALAEPTDKVEAALDRKSRLVTSGLVELCDNGDLDDRVQADKRLENLTPGDFAAVRRRLTCPGRAPTAENLLAELQAEVRVKEATAGRIGF